MNYPEIPPVLRRDSLDHRIDEVDKQRQKNDTRIMLGAFWVCIGLCVLGMTVIFLKAVEFSLMEV